MNLIVRRKYCLEKPANLSDVMKKKKREDCENNRQNNIRFASHVAIYIRNLGVILIRDTDVQLAHLRPGQRWRKFLRHQIDRQFCHQRGIRKNEIASCRFTRRYPDEVQTVSLKYQRQQCLAPSDMAVVAPS